MAKLAPTQIDQLQNIGAYLAQVRQDQGLSIEMLANQIFIRPALLRALESGSDGELPEPVFIQGFIRRYAEALGLDGQAIAQEFKVIPVAVLPTAESLAQADTNGVVEPETRHSIKVLQQESPKRAWLSLPLLLSLGGLLLVLGLGIWGWLGRSREPSQTDSNSSVAETVPDDSNAPSDAPSDAPETALDPLEETGDLATEAVLEAPVVVSASLSDRAWLSVVADGENVYEGVAESGFEETWTAQTSLEFTTGNAGGVELSVNGDRAVTVGDNGDVRTLTFTPDSDVESIQSP
ncbi:helix-turn-helix domain-containing protein [Nodosilinea sp. LEGE 07088]|uniref:helix-turn-helix domain-containing protein n=1 Tax=Nodosilinea sp. LEGE 07088 TaxID=2777968 RepID=UPI001881BFB3|nr:RodZ domain-containing protein [Nodosilinea sp. LEGE 07088]MBE9137512.1 helix-turn-helix domain-containing protein [Nodosilinea sp. LEGE 07088]